MKNEMNITFFSERGSNPVHCIQSPTHFRVVIKAGLYRKVVHVGYIHIPGELNNSMGRGGGLGEVEKKNIFF